MSTIQARLRHPELRLENVLAVAEERDLHIDRALVWRAYEMASFLHRNQKRYSGEPYILHPIEVAHILVREAIPDTATLCAALLHDTLEDCPEITPPELLARFGEEIFLIVSGVTKLRRAHFGSRDLQHVENLKRFFLESLYDLRILLIRLADRLHNLRTAQYHPDASVIRRSAQEAWDFYAPLGERFGMMRLAERLRDAALQILDPGTYRVIQQRLALEMERQRPRLHRLVRHLEESLSDALPMRNFLVKARIKSIPSIYRKIREQNLSFEEIQDLYGVRILVEKEQDCYLALWVVHKLWNYHGYFRDYIGNPKPNGYRALHTLVLTSEGTPLEVQIRTFEMDRIAEFGIAAHWLYKTGLRWNLVREQLPIFQELLRTEDLAENPGLLLEVLHKEFLTSEIFAYTPKGDRIFLPQGATPLDFAFKVHTDLGYRFAGAIVNGRRVGMDYTIKVGDVVEILTDPQVEPSPEWLDFARTPRAREKIRQYLRRKQRRATLQQARALLEREIEARGRHHLNLLSPAILRAYARKYRLREPEKIFFQVLRGDVSPGEVVRRLEGIYKELARAEVSRTPVEKEWTPPSQETKARQIGLRISGQAPEVRVQLGRCCRPVYGDKVQAVREGTAFRLHRLGCPELATAPPTEVFPADWESQKPDFLFPAAFHIIAPNRKGLLYEVTSIITEKGINILGNQIRLLRKDLGRLSFVVEVRDREELADLLRALHQRIPDLIQVERPLGHDLRGTASG